jgi:hypothetical protein
VVDGEQQIRRNASDLLDVKLIYRAALERRGHKWHSDPVAGEPLAVFVSSDGRPTFVYGFPITGYSLLPGRRLEKVVLVGSLVARGVYDEWGRVVQRSCSGRGDPAWN